MDKKNRDRLNRRLLEELCPRPPPLRGPGGRFIKNPCDHNERTRYEDGFRCNSKCGQWFSKDSPTYRRDELISTLWMVMNNINVERYRKGLPDDPDVAAMKERIGIGVDHSDDYEDIIAKCQPLMDRHGYKEASVKIKLKR